MKKLTPAKLEETFERIRPGEDTPQDIPGLEDHITTRALYLSSNEVARLTGVTLRQLQWWDEHKIVSPPKVNCDRVYTEDNLLEIILIRDLRLKQMSLQQIRWVLKRLRKGGPEVALAGRRYIIVDPLSRTLFVEEDPEVACEILDMLDGHSILIKVPQAPEPPIR
jgi:DNA-binding transcriptional MerR regulator